MANIKYKDNGTYKDIVVKVGDTLPIGTEVDYDGSVVPNGWEEVAKKGYVAKSWYDTNSQTIGNTRTKITGFGITINSTGGDILVTGALACNLTNATGTGSLWVYVDGTMHTTRLCTCKGNTIFNYFGQLLLTNVPAGTHAIELYGMSDNNSYNLEIPTIYNKTFSAIEL